MDPLILSRWQFAITTIYHFFFVPLTLGLSILIAIMETKYVTSGDRTYKRMVKFWGNIFLINYAAGVVTGIVQEFHFGLNWSEYSRFVGDVFGAPLAIEGLMAFFLESTFLGVWIFGWDKLSKRAHAAVIWLVAIGANISAVWILIANSFMQNPVGYAIENGRAVMTDFGALLLNPNVHFQFGHVFSAGITTAAFLVMGICAVQFLRKNSNPEIFQRSFRWAAIYGLVGTILVIIVGHAHGQWLGKYQPMKTSAAEAHWETQAPADFIIIAGIDQENLRNTWEIKIPAGLSFLINNNFSAEVPGIKDLQAEAETSFGPGNYIPWVVMTFWTFRIMVGLGFLMAGIAFLAVLFRNSIEKKTWFLRLLVPSIAFPYLAVSTGWIITEESRQPWIVYGLLRTADGLSPTLNTGVVLFTLIIFTVVISALTIITGYLIKMHGTDEGSEAHPAH